jgi:acyl carrier protein
MSTLQKLQDILIEDHRLTREQVAPDAELAQLGLDSLSVLELMFKIEDHFQLKIADDTPTDLVTVGDVLVYIDRLLEQKETSAGQPSASAPTSTQARLRA